jgi:hypothetical protein
VVVAEESLTLLRVLAAQVAFCFTTNKYIKYNP